jgi:Tfp pilus assembly protein PilN
VHAVNLLPSQLAEPRRTRLPLPLPLLGAGAVPLIASVLVGIGYSSAHSSVAAEQAKFAALQAQVAALAPVVVKTTTSSSAAQWSSLISERTARRAALDDVLNHQLRWDSMLRDVSRVLPADVWLTDLTFKSPLPFTGAASTGSSSSAADGFTINGYAGSETSVALLLERLRLVPILNDVTLKTTTSSTIGVKAVVQFAVSATVVPPGGLPAPATPAPTTTTTTPAGT